MSEHAELGMNRTGVSTSPKLTAEMVKGHEEFPPDRPGDERSIAADRGMTARRWADPIGSVPPPTSAKGALKSGMTALKGESPTQFIDKLGARCAFERSGVRLYEALLAKHDSKGSFAGGPSRADIEDILNEEFNHFRTLTEAIEKLGADPTVMTPSADLEATIGQGSLAVLVEPRTNLAQCLVAVLSIELVDNDAWTMLIKLAKQAGQGDMAKRFEQALKEEDEHVAKVRRWLSAAQGI